MEYSESEIFCLKDYFNVWILLKMFLIIAASFGCVSLILIIYFKVVKYINSGTQLYNKIKS
mgnify:CR=1 FL=1